MPDPTPEESRRLLEQWQVNPRLDADLADRVIQQVRQSPANTTEAPGFASWLQWLLRRPAYLGGFAAALLVTGGLIAVFAVVVVKSVNTEAEPLEYRLVIDPVYRLTQGAEHSVVAVGGAEQELMASLQWLKSELHLDAQQFAKLIFLHGAYEKTIADQYANLQANEARMRDFEELRTHSELIDFIQVYHTMESDRKLRDQAMETTADLVHQVSQIVSGEQRGRYLELIQNLPQTERAEKRGTPPAI